MIPSKKIDAVDAAKGLGIILVVFAHICSTEPYFTVVYSFHMPLFFILAGIVYNTDKYRNFKSLLKAKVKSLVVPYLIFCLMGVIVAVSVRAFKCIVHRGSINDIWSLLLKAAYSIVWAPYSHKYFGEFNTPMWFVPCLLLVFIMYYFASKYIKNKWMLAGTAVVISVLGWLMESSFIPFDFSVLPWNFSSACFSFGFFTAGNLCSDFLKKNLFGRCTAVKKKVLLICAFLIIMAATVYLALINGKVSIGSRMLKNGFLLYATGIAGTFGVLCLSEAISGCRFLKFCGKNSFTIMGIHYVIYSVILSAITFLKDLDDVEAANMSQRMLPSFLIFLTVLVLTLIFTFIYNYICAKVRKNNGRITRNP